MRPQLHPQSGNLQGGGDGAVQLHRFWIKELGAGGCPGQRLGRAFVPSSGRGELAVERQMKRSREKEMMDLPGNPAGLLEEDLTNLRLLNRTLGGYRGVLGNLDRSEERRVGKECR